MPSNTVSSTVIQTPGEIEKHAQSLQKTIQVNIFSYARARKFGTIIDKVKEIQKIQ
jgi:hypothetical protein